MGFLRNRVIVSFALAASGLTVAGCSGNTSAAGQAMASISPTLAACTSTYLGMSLGRRTGTATVTQALNLTNNGTTACVLDGFPGVNLMGVAHGLNQYTWTLQWATTPHSPVTVQPGGTAHFDVVYLPAPASSGTGASAEPASSATTAKPSPKPSAKPSASAAKSAAPQAPPAAIEVLDISITLPNTYTQDETAWNARLVLEDKDAHAKTYVTPFVAGSA